MELLRITFPYILFISLTSLAGGILNTWSRFSVPAFAPALLNVSFIAFALWLVPYFDPPIKALAWAVFAGGLLQLGFLLPFLLASLAFAVILLVVPYPRPRLRDVWPGIAVAATTGLLAGVIPAWHAARTNIVAALNQA